MHPDGGSLSGGSLCVAGTAKSICQASGLVADGRDMGTVVFPDATHKDLPTASAEERAEAL